MLGQNEKGTPSALTKQIKYLQPNLSLTKIRENAPDNNQRSLFSAVFRRAGSGL